MRVITINNKPIIFPSHRFSISLSLMRIRIREKIRYRIDRFFHPFFPSTNHSQLATLSNISGFNTACSVPEDHPGGKKGKAYRDSLFTESICPAT